MYLEKKQMEKIKNMLKRVEGQVRGVYGMIEQGRCIDEVILQIVAVRSALDRIALELLNTELDECVSTCMSESNEERIERLKNIVKMLIKRF